MGLFKAVKDVAETFNFGISWDSKGRVRKFYYEESTDCLLSHLSFFVLVEPPVGDLKGYYLGETYDFDLIASADKIVNIDFSRMSAFELKKYLMKIIGDPDNPRDPMNRVFHMDTVLRRVFCHEGWMSIKLGDDGFRYAPSSDDIVWGEISPEFGKLLFQTRMFLSDEMNGRHSGATDKNYLKKLKDKGYQIFIKNGKNVFGDVGYAGKVIYENAVISWEYV